MKKLAVVLVLLSFLGILIFTLGCANTKLHQVDNPERTNDMVGVKTTIGF